MELLTWTISHQVFVPELDDEHQGIFIALGTLQTALSQDGPAAAVLQATESLVASVEEHFAHEDRLMRAARYASRQWHQRSHASAQKRVAQYTELLREGARGAGNDLVAYLSAWLHDHTLVADRMLGAFLRNQCRTGKITLQASTRPAGDCAWVDSEGRPFEPQLKRNIL
jgi:hemerythrin-like metal-binding protein